MSILNQLLTIMRGRAREAAEAVIDANALALLSQQLHECEAVLLQARQDLTRVVAERIAVEREIGDLENLARDREIRIRQALVRGDEAGALELAQRLAVEETRLARSRDNRDRLLTHEREVGDALRAAADQVRDQRRELGLLKATAHAQRATTRLHGEAAPLADHLWGAEETSARIRRSQQAMADRLGAARQVDRILDGTVRVARAEQSQRAADILARLRAMPPSPTTQP